MRRGKRETIAVRGDDVRSYDSEYACAKDIKVSVTSVQAAKRWNATTGEDWFIYDAPDKIRERIKELEGQLEMLAGLGIR